MWKFRSPVPRRTSLLEGGSSEEEQTTKARKWKRKPRFLQKVSFNFGSGNMSLIIEVDFHKFPETAGIIIA